MKLPKTIKSSAKKSCLMLLMKLLLISCSKFSWASPLGRVKLRNFLTILHGTRKIECWSSPHHLLSSHINSTWDNTAWNLKLSATWTQSQSAFKSITKLTTPTTFTRSTCWRFLISKPRSQPKNPRKKTGYCPTSVTNPWAMSKNQNLAMINSPSYFGLEKCFYRLNRC